MKMNGVLLCALLLASLVVGCSTRQVLTTLGVGAAAGAGAATVYYVKGDLEADLNHELDRVEKASFTVVTNRNYKVTDKQASDTTRRIGASIPATGSEKERDLTIKLERKEEKVTHVFIRVGVFGDEALARAILNDIQATLK